MTKDRILNMLELYKQSLEQDGYDVIYIGLYGSQNYNVSDDNSDIDAKAIVLPALKDIIHRRVISVTAETDYGNIDVKDLITFNDVIRKGNFSYIEAVQTEYYIGDKELIDDLFGDIKINLKSIIGGMHEKRKALTHEYPSKYAEFAQWGCDPKQYHHIVRLYDVLYENIKNETNRAYISYEGMDADYMIKLKRGQAGLEVPQMEAAADKYIEMAKQLLDTKYPDYKYQPSVDNQDKVDDYIENRLLKRII